MAGSSSIRLGKVSSVNYKTGMMRVTYSDKGKAVTSEMPYANYNNEYSMPRVGESVLTAHLSNGSSRGVVIGTMWNKNNIPPETGNGIYRKDLSKTKGAALCRYDDASGEYLLKAPNVEIDGINGVTIDGPKVTIDASISIQMETEKMLCNASEISVAVKNLTIGKAESGEAAASMNIKNHSDITFHSEESFLKFIIKSLVFKALQDISIETEQGVRIKAKEKVELEGITGMGLISDTAITLEDAKWKTTLSHIMDRLEALDGDSSDKK